MSSLVIVASTHGSFLDREHQQDIRNQMSQARDRRPHERSLRNSAEAMRMSWQPDRGQFRSGREERERRQVEIASKKRRGRG
jgi:hypothetical protein